MRKLIFSMSVSLDGYTAGPGGDIEWGAPDDELHRFHNDRVRELGGHLLGRRLYETMLYWETADQDPSIGATELDFARVWQPLPKVVYSTTLDDVVGRNVRLAREVVPEEIAEMKAHAGGDLGGAGPGVPAPFSRLGLIDEYETFVSPVVLGGSTPFLRALEAPMDL